MGDYYLPQTVHFKGSDMPEVWAKELCVLMNIKNEIVAGEDYKGNAKKTKDANFVIELDEKAVEGIVNGKVHPAFESKDEARTAYEFEFSYWFVFHNWTLDPKLQFVYNYMDRFINYPAPDNDFMYQGRLGVVSFDERYATKFPVKFHGDKLAGDIYTGGMDQIKWLHDAIRKDGISRRHEIITWVPQLDCFNVSPPCLQRIMIRVLVPIDERKKYPGCIPVEVHIEYRSWDIPRAQPSNLQGLLKMLYRYVLGNLTPDNECIWDENGSPIRFNDEGNDIEFKIVRAVLFGDACHSYEDSYDTCKRVKRLRDAP